MANRFEHNLPLQLTQFIGRQREIEQITRLITGDHSTGVSEPDRPTRQARTRLITLTGPGGGGKTRLAVETAAAFLAASQQEPIFPDGVWFIDLAPLQNPALVPQIISSTLNLTSGPTRSAQETLIQALKNKKLLLLPDNCEHLLEATARLSHLLLQECPQIVILATSRMPMNLPEEVNIPVPALAIINPDPQQPITNLLNSEAVRLFVDRASAVQPDFQLNKAQATAVLEICRKLDGLPLAIELAAARIKMLTPQQIARRIDDAYFLFRNSSPLAADRHQNLQAAFDWSFALLNEPERVLFSRLSVFGGGWTLSAAEFVAGFNPLTPEDIFNLHEQLLNQSLIIRADDGLGAQARYRMLEPLRQFGAEKRVGTDANDRHLEYFTSLAAEAWAGILTGNYESWFDRLDDDIGNIRQALDWAMVGGKIELGMETAVSLFHFWLEHNYMMESIEVMENFLNHPRLAAPTLIRAKGLAFLSLSYLRLGDQQNALKAAEEALEIEEIRPDPIVRGYALAGVGHALALRGDYQQALAVLLQSLEVFRAEQFPNGQAWPLSRLGNLAILMGDYASAESWLAEMVELLRNSGNSLYLAFANRFAGYALILQRKYKPAISKCKETLLKKESQYINPANLVFCAMIALDFDRIKESARLLGAVKFLTGSFHIILLPYDDYQFKRCVARIKPLFKQAPVQKAWEDGHKLSMQQAVEEAKALLDTLSSINPTAQYPHGLTKREVEVLQLVALGLTNQQIAERLVISRRTVHAHLRSIYGKLEVNTRTGAAHEANRLQLV